MTTTTLLPPTAAKLGEFLRERRAQLRPESGARGHRRTPGLRREEVAARAGVSVTWYTWLEQGRGGPPSDELLERLARALELDATSREFLFLIAQHRPPPLTPNPLPQVATSVQRVLDGMPTSPAFVKTRLWDIVAWNAAAIAVLGDFAAMSPPKRNMLRRLFLDPASRVRAPHWNDRARTAVEVFRMDAARAGASQEVLALLEELMAASEDFRKIWAGNAVQSQGAGAKRIAHADLGMISFESNSFVVEGAEGLSMVVYSPVTAEDRRGVETLCSRR